MIVICSNTGQCHNVAVKQEGKPQSGGDDPETPEWLTREFYHRSLAMRFTATWCGYCPTMNESIETAMAARPDKFEYVALHGSSSDLYFSGSDALMNQYGINGFPTGIADGRAQIGNFGVDAAAKLFIAVLDETEKNYSTATSPVFESKISGNSISIDVTIYAKVADNYKITAMLLEDGIIGYQADYVNGSKNDYRHNSVARAAFTNPKGDDAVIADPAQPWKKSYSVQIPEGCNKDNLRILVYIQRPYGSQQQVKGVPSVTYGNYGGCYVDNALSAPAGVKTQIVYVEGGSENIGITDPIG